VLVKEGEEFFEYVWELVGFSHDTNEHWELAQVFVHATEVKMIKNSKELLENLSFFFLFSKT
jgi:hypothetical protein